MALITCPECGKEVSDQAEVCIHCGYPLKKLNAKTQEPVNMTATPVNNTARQVPPPPTVNNTKQDFRTPYQKRVAGRKKALIIGAISGFLIFILLGQAGFRLLSPVLPVTLVCLVLWVLSRFFNEDFWGTRIFAYPFWFTLTFIPFAAVGTLLHEIPKYAIQIGLLGK